MISHLYIKCLWPGPISLLLVNILTAKLIGPAAVKTEYDLSWKHVVAVLGFNVVFMIGYLIYNIDFILYLTEIDDFNFKEG